MSSVRIRSMIFVFGALFTLGFASAGSAESQPNARDSTGDVVELEAGLSHAYLPAETSSQMHARVQVRAKEVETEGRAPLNLAVVLDRSGSMRGGRLTQAKRAARRLVDRLSPDDRLAIVAYGSGVRVRANSQKVTQAHKKGLRAAISGIASRGNTNLAGGFERARSIVEEHATEATVDRVVVLSDGKANRGPDTPRALGSLARTALSNGVSTTTMGIGLNYDEDIMVEMADKGAGNHYFIEDESKIASVFGEEFEQLAGVVARDAFLVFKLGDGIELLDVHGYSHRRSHGNIVVDLGALHGRQQRDVLVDLATTSAGGGERPVLDVNLHFADVTGSNDEDVTNRVSLVAVGTSESDKHDDVDEWVMRRVEQVEYARSVDDASDAFDSGDRERASRIIEEQKERLDRAEERDVLSPSKVRAKKEELEEKQSTMGRSSAQGASGKRLKKRSADESLQLMKDSSAF